MFFDGSVRSTRRISFSGRWRASFSPASITAGLSGEVVELGGVHGDRRRRDDDAPTVVAEHVARPVGHRADGVLGDAHEVPAPAARVEADDVVREQPVVDRAPHLDRQHRPAVGSRPRDVHEVHEPRLRPRVSNDARRDVEVIVVEEDRCARIAIELVQDGVGESAG